MMDDISLSEPILGSEEQRALCDVIESRWLTMGERVIAFEKAFAGVHKVGGGVALSSCTAALHLALEASGIGIGDEVLVPSLTFVATVNAVLYVGATPIFVEIEDLHHPHISIVDAAAKLTKKTRAVILMHYGGYVADLVQWRQFCDQNELILIEDAAHAPAVGKVGQLSDAATFSFFSNKNLSTAEGGMLLSKHQGVLQRARMLRAHGMSTDTLTRHKGHAFSYQVSMLGYNYRMDELRAAIGLVQLAQLENWNRKRFEITQIYRHFLSEKIPNIGIPFHMESETAAHLMPVLLPRQSNREKVMAALRRLGIQSSIHYPSVHKFDYYQKRFPGIVLPRTEEFCERELTLPLHPSLGEADVTRVVESLKDALEKN